MSKKTPHDSDVSFIQSLAELLRENDLTELQVKRDYGENDSLNVRVSRQTQAVVQATVPVGATVKEGDTLLIIEAMKTMNHIPAPRAGTIKRILVEDGAPVEFGAPLVILE